MANVPTHIGYIVDGNRRWASARGEPAYKGHIAGYKALKEVIQQTIDAGVRYTSLYVFSTENWKRSSEEVDKLMGLLLTGLGQDLHIFTKNNIRIRFLGSKKGLSKAVVAAMSKAEAETRSFTGAEVLLCLNYGGQQEIVEAVKRIVDKAIASDAIDEAMIASELYAPDVPPCDLIVRTSGEQRLSNFMLWRSTYSELLFVDKNWPEMTKQDVTDILEEYNNRARRFGG